MAKQKCALVYFSNKTATVVRLRLLAAALTQTRVAGDLEERELTYFPVTLISCMFVHFISLR